MCVGVCVVVVGGGDGGVVIVDCSVVVVGFSRVADSPIVVDKTTMIQVPSVTQSEHVIRFLHRKMM